jgi:hypothetical protein
MFPGSLSGGLTPMAISPRNTPVRKRGVSGDAGVTGTDGDCAEN